jgi:hypothetical protein
LTDLAKLEFRWIDDRQKVLRSSICGGGTEFEMFFPAFIKKELKALEMSAGSVNKLSFTLIFSTFSFEEDLFKASLISFQVFLGSFLDFLSPSSKYYLLLALISPL